RTNARGVHPGGGGDRQDAPGGGVLDLGRVPRGRRPGGRRLGGSGTSLRAAGGGDKAALGARKGPRRPPGERVALRAFSALARAQGEVPRPSFPYLRRRGDGQGDAIRG